MTMTRNGPPALLWGKLAWHPAVKAWSEVADDPVVPESIEVLRPGSQSAIYRLMGAGPEGGNVVARQVPLPQAALERAVYEDILPLLPVAAPRQYGCWAEGEHGSWLFFEDVGGERCYLADRGHRALAARWVGRLHTEATRIVAAQALPEAGPPRYLEHLRAGRRAIRAQLANPALTAGSVDVLPRVVACLDALEHDWVRIERACAGVPATLVHGDLRPRNLRLRNHANGGDSELIPINWKTAGWGVPAADLPAIDLPTYWSTVRARWPDVGFADVRRLAGVGRVFRRLAAIRRLAEPAADSPGRLGLVLASLQSLHVRLADAVRALHGPGRE
jgi:aminoglycoside phosphotransferase (APT) family kinase protein